MGKRIITNRFVTIFLTLLTLSFFLGFFLGFQFHNDDLDKLNLNYEKTELDLKSINEMINFYNFFDNKKICKKNILDQISMDLYKIGLKLDSMEKNNSDNTIDYDLLKQKYNINQVLFYTEFRKYSKICNYDSHIILFFFNGSNSKLNYKQGRELSKLVTKYDLKILPMDYGYTKSLKYFYEFYNITKLPTLIIDYNLTKEGFMNASEIEYIINKKNN